MKAWLLDGYNGIESLRLAEVPDPVPGAGEVLVQVEYAALNPADRYLAQKLYPARPTFPHVLGREGLGRVAALGAGVTQWKIGDEVLILPGPTGADRWGSFAEKVVVPADELVSFPAGWDKPAAAGVMIAYLTAWQALTQWGELHDATVLVTGASGGVGMASVHLAGAMGCSVVALTRSDDKLPALREQGAAIALNCSKPSWVKALKDQLGTKRVDLAVDNVGGDLFSQVIDTLGMYGRVSVVGRLAGPVPEFNTATLFFRRLRIGGVAVTADTSQGLQRAWTDVSRVLQGAGKVPMVDQVLPMGELPNAFGCLAEGPMGKVIVQTAGQ